MDQHVYSLNPNLRKSGRAYSPHSAMDELRRAWFFPGSSIYLNYNWREIKKYCEKNQIDVTKESILRFIETNRSSNLKAENGTNLKSSHISKNFALRPRFFSQIHSDVLFLSGKRSYKTTMRYILIISCALSNYVMVESLNNLKFHNVKKAFLSLISRIKNLVPNFKAGEWISDGGSEWENSSFKLLLKEFGFKQNIVRLRDYRGSKGSGYIENKIRYFRRIFERVILENKGLNFREILNRAERICNESISANIKMSPLDALLMKPLDVLSLKMSHRLQNRKYLKREIMQQHELPIGSIVRVKKFVSKSFHSTVKESYGRYSEYMVITSCDKSREIYTYVVSDIFLFTPLNGKYNRYELKVCSISLMDACLKEERAIKRIVKKTENIVFYESYYRDYVFCANKSILD